MEVLLLGGFLGSGKTTVVNKLLHGITGQGLTAAVVENEIGQVGIDDALLSTAGVQVTPLFGGCVCCQISGDLLSAVHRIQEEVNPHWLVIEMTGLALMDGIRNIFNQYGRTGMTLHTVSVVDMSRWEKLLRAMEPVVTRQLQGADLVLVNKTDVTPPTDGALAKMSALAGGSPCLPVSAAAMADGALWSLVKGALV